jgi:mono/diheme cytochrome c family protein
LSTAQIRRQLNLGTGGMPSFRDRLTDRQEAAVAAFVAAAMRERKR